MSRTARVTLVEGTSHASDILSPHHVLNDEIADWFAARLASRSAPALWGGLQPGAYEVGFRRESAARGAARTVIDLWYPAVSAPGRMRFEDYLRLSDDLRAGDSAAGAARSSEEALSIAVSGEPDGVPPDVARRILAAGMAAGRDAVAAQGSFPLVLWTPRYATTVAQATLSEYLAGLGFVVAFPRPAAGGRMPFELPTTAAKTAELEERIGDMRAAVAHLENRPHVDARRIGVLAWSYSGEMATGFQLREPRVALVAGMSTTLLNDWVFEPAGALEALDASRLTAAYAVLAQAPAPRAPALDGVAAGYVIEFPGLAHGSFNALEGHIPSLFGVSRVQRWSQASPAGIEGYEAAGVIISRLLRHHVEQGRAGTLARLPLTTGIRDGVVRVRPR